MPVLTWSLSESKNEWRFFGISWQSIARRPFAYSARIDGFRGGFPMVAKNIAHFDVHAMMWRVRGSFMNACSNGASHLGVRLTSS